MPEEAVKQLDVDTMAEHYDEDASTENQNIGRVIQISGPAVDVQFDEATMPSIF